MRLLLFTIAGVLVLVIPLRAAIVFTNFQSASPTGCTVPPTGNTVACAAAFTPSANYTMTDAQVEVETLIAPVNGNFDLFLYSNNSGVPGSSLGMIGTGIAPTTFGIVTVNSPALSLISGTEYWLVMGPHDSNTFMNWADGGNPVPPAAVDTNWPGSNWSPNPTASSQFQIDGTLSSSTPEPATLGLVVAGVLLVTLRRRLRMAQKNCF